MRQGEKPGDFRFGFSKFECFFKIDEIYDGFYVVICEIKGY